MLSRISRLGFSFSNSLSDNSQQQLIQLATDNPDQLSNMEQTSSANNTGWQLYYSYQAKNSSLSLNFSDQTSSTMQQIYRGETIGNFSSNDTMNSKSFNLNINHKMAFATTSLGLYFRELNYDNIPNDQSSWGVNFNLDLMPIFRIKPSLFANYNNNEFSNGNSINNDEQTTFGINLAYAFSKNLSFAVAIQNIQQSSNFVANNYIENIISFNVNYDF
jgi:hypothetical protein